MKLLTRILIVFPLCISPVWSAEKPKVIFFDVNETLPDLNAMRKSVADALGGRDDLMSL